MSHFYHPSFREQLRFNNSEQQGRKHDKTVFQATKRFPNTTSSFWLTRYQFPVLSVSSKWIGTGRLIRATKLSIFTFTVLLQILFLYYSKIFPYPFLYLCVLYLRTKNQNLYYFNYTRV